MILGQLFERLEGAKVAQTPFPLAFEDYSKSVILVNVVLLM